MLEARSTLAFFLGLLLPQVAYLSFLFSSADAVLFGHKTVALTDLWSLQHFATGIVLGYLGLQFLRFKHASTSFLLLLVTAYTWEYIELMMEAGLFGQLVQTWKDGIELPYNRLIIDPILLLAGAYLALRIKRSHAIAAMVFVAAFGLLHVFAPHSNSWQEILLATTV